jgi:hypothetical protein
MLSGKLWAESFIVTSNLDSGPGTLREAVAASDTTTGVQTITFAISNSITVNSTIQINSPVIIDGKGTTIGSTGVTILDLDAGSSGSEIKGLALINAKIGEGIDISTSNGNTITGCAIGTDWLNSIGVGNKRGIYLNYSNCNIIGGNRLQGNGNIISGNQYSGVSIGYSNYCLIAGNIIGLNSSQTVQISNGGIGIYLDISDGNMIGLPLVGYENIICGNGSSGIDWSKGDNNIIKNNYIGITPADQVWPNRAGISLDNANNNLFGGILPYEKNIISGNQFIEISISFNSAGNTIVGNFIGSNVAGTQAVISSNYQKISVMGRNSIGLKATGNGNLIVGGSYGIIDNEHEIGGFFGNTICGFSSQGISVPNRLKPNLQIQFANLTQAEGISDANNYIELFLAEKGAGFRGGSIKYLGFGTADSDGKWNIAITGLVRGGDYLCAIATNSNNETFEFSNNFQIVVPTSTPTTTPTISPTCTCTSTITPTITITPPATITPTTSCTPTVTKPAVFNIYGKDVLAFPNPAKGVVRFIWAESGAERVKITMFNLLGERIATLTATSPGQSLDWNASGVAPGIYIYRVTLTVNGAEHQLPVGKIAVLKP